MDMDITGAAIFGAGRGLCGGAPLPFQGFLSLITHLVSLDLADAGSLTVFALAGVFAALAARYLRQFFRAVKETAVMVYRMCRSGFSFALDSTPAQRDAVMFLLTALPSLIVLLAGKMVTGAARDTDIIAEGVCFLLCGSYMLAACSSPEGDVSDGSLRPGQAILIGLSAALGMMPGFSGFAMALSTALITGCEPRFAVRYSSFAAVIPALCAAFSGAGMLDPAQMRTEPLSALLCAAAAAVFCFGAVWLTGLMAKKDKLSVFAYIMIAFGLAAVILGTVETAAGISVADLIAAVKG